MRSSVTFDELLTSLQAGDRVMLPNAGAALRLRAAYDGAQRARGLAGWQPAGAVAWSQWTNSLFGELIVSGAETRLLMNAAQEKSLWKAIIEDDEPMDSLESAESMAELAASAMRLAGSWGAVGRLRAAASGPMGNNDTRIFAHWAEEFQRRCVAQQLLPTALLEETLAKHVAAKALVVANELRLVGFQHLTPAQTGLLEALRKAGTQIVEQEVVFARPPVLHASVTLERPVDELQFVARWLRTTLEGAQERGDSPSIAVLVPGLREEQAEMEAVFRNTLAPELQAVSEDLSSTPWQFSSGASLSSLSLIADALDIARWVVSALPVPRITALLLSPYLGSAAEREEAGRLDALLRRRENLLRPELSLSSFIALLDKHQSTLAWPHNLMTELARSGDMKRPRSYAEWMEMVRTLVQATGWPNAEARALTATEFEATRAWDGVLDLVATLDFNGQRVAFATALQALELQAKAVVLQPPATQASVQVMTPEEAEGSVFDAVVFMRTTDANWPVGERTHPLLPWQLQKDLAMPGTDPLRAAERALTLGRSLTSSAGTVLFTRANADADGHLRPSPVLSELGLTTVSADSLVAPVAPEQLIAYERVVDDAPLPGLRTTEFHGGATLLKLQAACGFLAYAQLRLNAGPLESSDLGLDARESGTLVHKVLHLFWQMVRDSETLASYSEAERAEMLTICIDRAMAAEAKGSGSAWDEAYLQVLRERLLRLLMQWLECELERSPFEVIATERRSEITVGTLELRVQMDRIDNILDQHGKRLGELYIDYKTGASARPAQWDGDRPDEPQLPLYTLQSEPEDVMGVAFAKLRAGDDMRYTGMQVMPGVLGTKSPKPVDLSAQIGAWRGALTQLAVDFAEGRAAVDPKQYPQTCKHCQHRLLCRLDPSALNDADDEEETEETDG